jgi:hypothetical protein
MDADHAPAGPPVEDEPLPGTGPDLSEWLKEVRSPENPELGKPPEAAPPRPSRLRHALVAIPLLVAGAAFYLGATASPPEPAGPRGEVVQGLIWDAARQPLSGARVFVEDYPELTARTDDDGGFVLKRVPAGPHTLVVVVADIGQEYSVKVVRDRANVVGAFVYSAPRGS